MAGERPVQLAERDGAGQMGAALGLRYDVVNDAQREKVRRRQLHELAGLGAAGSVFPQDGGKAFGREDGVHGVFQHEHPVGNAQRQCTAAVALAGDDGDDGDLQPAHLKEVAGDGLALAPLLGLQAGVGAGGIDEGEDGAAELLRLAHEPQGLAVALRTGHAEVALEVFLQRLALAGADDGDGPSVVEGHAAQNGGVLSGQAVTPLLEKVGEQRADEVGDVGPLGMAGNGHPLGGGESSAHTRPPFSCSRSSWARVSRISVRDTT